MSHQINSKKICYHIMKGKRYIFADERNKKKLLDIVLDIQMAEGWHIYTFCITDDCAYFIVEASSKASVLQGMSRAADSYLSFCKNTRWNQGRFAAEKLSGSTAKELRSLQDIAALSRKIHRIPLEEGYVSRIGDYWWSSYITYMGSYEWKMVDCHVLFLYFSMDIEIARHRLQQYHRQLSIINNGEIIEI